MSDLPVDIDSTFPDRDAGDALHQQHHDSLHALYNELKGSESAAGLATLQAILDGTYAPVEDAALEGTPTAPTAAPGTDTTQVATTEFVTDAVDNATYAPLGLGRIVHKPSSVTRLYHSPARPTSTGSFLEGRQFGVVVPLGFETTFDRITAEVTGAGVSASIRLGVYSYDGATFSLVDGSDSGDLDASTTGLKEGVIDLTLDPGMYLFSMRVDIASVTVRTYDPASNPWFSMTNASNGITGTLGCYQQVAGPGVMGATFTPTSFAGFAPWIGLGRS